MLNQDRWLLYGSTTSSVSYTKASNFVIFVTWQIDWGSHPIIEKSCYMSIRFSPFQVKFYNLLILLQKPARSRARQFVRPSNWFKKHVGLDNWVEHELEPEKPTYQYRITYTFVLYFPHVYPVFSNIFFFPGELRNYRKGHSFNKLVPYTRISVKFMHKPQWEK